MPSLRHRAGDLIQGRYEVRKALGSGAYGTVYGCRDCEIDVPVAVKELHVLDSVPGSGERDAALRSFRAEATHLSRLRHPHIVSGHFEPHAGDWRICPVCGLDFPGATVCPDHGAPLFALASRHYLVMEYLGGMDLLQLAESRGGRIPVDEVLGMATEVASALAHLHARGFVHRDIKPENIRLRADSGEAVLLDFGIATTGMDAPGDRYGTRTLRHTRCGGTAGYAPAWEEEQNNPDARSDVHAFGMTLYHLLTGLDPTEPRQLARMRQHAPGDFVDEIPEELDDLILSCIALAPRERFQDGAAVLTALESLGADSADAPQDAVQPFAPAAGGFGPQAPPPGFAGAAEPFLVRLGVSAGSVAELAPLLDQYPADAARHIVAGELENWLFSIGENGLGEAARAARSQYRNRPARALETFAQATGLLEPPGVLVAPNELNFGRLGPTQQRTLNLQIENTRRGHSFGRLWSTHPAISTPGEWDGNAVKIPVTFDAFRVRPGNYSGHVRLESISGDFVVPFTASATGPSRLPAFFSVLLCGSGGMAFGGVLRALPASFALGRSGAHWMNAGTHLNWYPFVLVFGLTFGALWLLWSLGEALFRRSFAILFMGFVLTGPVALVAGFSGLDLLVAVDEALRPHLQTLVGNLAAGGWMAAGGGLGALIGTVRRPRDLFSVRAPAFLAGWLAVAALFFLALAGVSASAHGR